MKRAFSYIRFSRSHQKECDSLRRQTESTAKFSQISDSIAWIRLRLGLKPRLKYMDGCRGLVGENHFILPDIAHVLASGWVPRCNIRQGVEITLARLQKNPHSLGCR